jgi:hypothetical protein
MKLAGFTTPDGEASEFISDLLPYYDDSGGGNP